MSCSSVSSSIPSSSSSIMESTSFSSSSLSPSVRYDEDGLVEIDSDDDEFTLIPLLPDSPTPSTTPALLSSVSSNSLSSIPSFHLPSAASSTISSSVSSLAPSSSSSALSPPALSPAEKSQKMDTLAGKLNCLVNVEIIYSSSVDLSETLFSPRGAAFRKLSGVVALVGENPTDAQLQRIEDRLGIEQGKLRVYLDAIAELNRRTHANPSQRPTILTEISTRFGLTSEQFDELTKSAN